MSRLKKQTLMQDSGGMSLMTPDSGLTGAENTKSHRPLSGRKGLNMLQLKKDKPQIATLNKKNTDGGK